MKIRRADERGHADHGWLDTRHTFSFASYHDPRYMGFRSLRVLNEDRVAPGGGFPKHAHRDMEIITLVLSGALAHEDSMGNGSTIRPGEVQKMSAGTGVVHSEMNASDDEPVHFLQIWILPDREGLAPMYQQEKTPFADEPNRLHLVGGSPGSKSLVEIYQDVYLHAARIENGSVSHDLDSSRYGWLHVAAGDEVVVNGETLSAGDAAAFDPGTGIGIENDGSTTLLLFDLA